jgi:AsmA protein
LQKTLKILAITFGGLLILLVGVAVILTQVINPNDYKGKIIEAVKGKTGRELRMDGKLGWSFFPWLGIETGQIELGNASGFGPDPFARIDGAGAKVELLPLLRKQVVVDTVFLNGLKLNLARNAAGKTNWDDLTAPAKVEKAREKTEPGKTPDIGGISINKIDIRKADISWDDKTSGAHYALRNLDLQTGKIIMSKPVDVQLSFDLESSATQAPTRVSLKSSVDLDLESKTLAVDNLTLALGDLSLYANFKSEHIFEAPTVSGALEISPLNPRALMDKLGVKLETNNKLALNKLSLKTKFNATTDSVELKELAVHVDDSLLSGALAVRHFAKPAYQFDLALDQIDIDDYLPPPAPAASGAKPGPKAAPAPVAIPLSLLRALTVQGKIRIQKLKAMNVHSSDVTIQLSADNGLITLGPNQARLYDGKYAGRTTLNVRGNTPLLAIDESLSGVELAPMLKDALKFDKFTGTANLAAKVTAQGLDARQVTETLKGTASFSVESGAIKGIDLKKMTDTIAAAQRDKSFQKLTELTPQAGDETRFTQLSGSVQINNGIVHNDDLKIQSPNLLNVSGKGSVDLPKETLNYTVTVGTFPIIVDGPFAKPRFKPDWNAILKGRVEEKKTELKEKLQEKLMDKLRFR